MYGLLADHKCAGHLAVILRICPSDRWRDIWLPLGVRVATFESLGIASSAGDATPWALCQREGLFLVTANRNGDGPDSLQAAIAGQRSLQSSPVLTLADTDRLLTEPAYAERAAIRLMEILLAPERERGTGRLYLPATPDEVELR